jgi:MFS family permease
VLGSVIQAVCIALIALTAFTLEGVFAGWSILALLVVFSLSRGLSSVSSKDVLGKTIPKHRRGILNGWAESGAGLITLVVAVLLISGLIFVQGDGGDTALYAFGFAGAALLWLVAAVIYATISEQPGDTEGGRNGLLEAFSRVTLLKTDMHFRHFLIARSMMLCSALSAPFVVVLAQQEMDAMISLLALFMAASGLASLVSGPFWGRFADVSSRLVMIRAGMMAAMVGVLVFVIAMFATDWLSQIWLLPLLYFVLSIAHQGVRLGRKTYVVNMAEGNKRTDYVSVGNTLIGVVLLLMGFVSSLEPLIGISGVICVLSGMGFVGSWMATRLPEVEKV